MTGFTRLEVGFYCILLLALNILNVLTTMTVRNNFFDRKKESRTRT